MELAEPIEEINKKLVDYYGLETSTGRPMWRVVWSEDQYEHRLTTHTPEGLQLIHPQVMLMKKYPYIQEKWVLERLVEVPIVNERELPASKLSYEPMYQFVYPNTGNYKPPTIAASKFIVDTVYAALGKVSLGAKYKDPTSGSIEERRARVKQLEEELFGDESGLEGKTHLTGEGIVVPSNYQTTQKDS
jgi:hypothetical protein